MKIEFDEEQKLALDVAVHKAAGAGHAFPYVVGGLQSVVEIQHVVDALVDIAIAPESTPLRRAARRLVRALTFVGLDVMAEKNCGLG